jgi:hypothetical protein
VIRVGARQPRAGAIQPVQVLVEARSNARLVS